MTQEPFGAAYVDRMDLYLAFDENSIRNVDLTGFDPTTQSTDKYYGTYSSGTQSGESVKLEINGKEGKVAGTVSVFTGGTLIDHTGTPQKNATGMNFIRTDGKSCIHHCYWLRITKRTATDANGKTLDGQTYNPGAPIYDVDNNGNRLYVTRTYGQAYIDPTTTQGYTAVIRPAENNIIKEFQKETDWNIRRRIRDPDSLT